MSDVTSLFNAQKENFARWEILKDVIDQQIDLMLNYRQSGHPGGSRSKVHYFVSLLLSGAMRWDIRHPEKRFGDRFVLVAGHCVPLVYATLTVFNEALRVMYEKTGDAGTDTEKWMSFNLQYNLGFMKVGGFYGTGNTETGNDHRSYMLTATAPMGAGEFRFSYGKLTNKTADVDAAKGFGVGYHYSMSKRTTLYADLVRNTGALVGGSNETGYDVGIKHNF